MRLFVAIQLNQSVKQLAKDVQSTFKQFGVRGNYTSQENLHITLAFIGEYGDPTAVMDALKSVRFAPFAVTIDEVGSFDELWWMGPSDSGDLNKLAGKVRHALSDAGIDFDKKKFKPHVTILRKPVYGKEGRMVHMSIEPESLVADRISLMSSTRGKNGMIYKEIGSVSAQ